MTCMTHKPRRRGITLYLVSMAALVSCAGPPQATSISPGELDKRIVAGKAPLILDVRSTGEFAQGHIPGALNIPHTRLSERLEELAQHRSGEIVVHCQRGGRAQMARDVLREAGFERLLDLEGHMGAWVEQGLPVEK